MDADERCSTVLGCLHLVARAVPQCKRTTPAPITHLQVGAVLAVVIASVASVSGVVQRELYPLKLVTMLEEAAKKRAEQQQEQRGADSSGGDSTGTEAAAKEEGQGQAKEGASGAADPDNNRLSQLLSKVGRWGLGGGHGGVCVMIGTAVVAPRHGPLRCGNSWVTRPMPHPERLASPCWLAGHADAEAHVVAAQVEPGDGGGAAEHRDRLLQRRIPAHGCAAHH